MRGHYKWKHTQAALDVCKKVHCRQELRGLLEGQQVPPVAPKAGVPRPGADTAEVGPHPPGVVMVVAATDGGEGQQKEPAFDAVGAGLKRPLEADVAHSGAGEGVHADLGGGVDITKEQDAEEGPEDCPIKLLEEGHLWTALDHQASVGEEDQDHSVEKVEGEG